MSGMLEFPLVVSMVPVSKFRYPYGPVKLCIFSLRLWESEVHLMFCFLFQDKFNLIFYFFFIR